MRRPCESFVPAKSRFRPVGSSWCLLSSRHLRAQQEKSQWALCWPFCPSVLSRQGVPFALSQPLGHGFCLSLTLRPVILGDKDSTMSFSYIRSPLGNAKLLLSCVTEPPGPLYNKQAYWKAVLSGNKTKSFNLRNPHVDHVQKTMQIF